jgi:glycosyltransferase involved in cell wall biosynthesis
MPAPQVSVVLPTRNRASMLMQALSSALSQEGVRLEVVVIDEGSSDDTPERLERIDDERLRVLRHDPAKGVAPARNAAIARARGEWIAFLDDDDLWAPENLRTQLAAAGEGGHALSYCRRLEIDERGSVMNVSHRVRSDDLARRLLANNVIGGPSGVLVRADLLERVGAFDERLSALADWDLWIRAAAGGTAVACPEQLVAYRHHPQNMMTTDAPAIMAEFELLREKHQDAARRAGVEFGVAWLTRWRAARDLAAGRRLSAARGFFRSGVRLRDRRDLARGIGALGGGLFQRVGRSAERRMTARPDWLDRYA